jgi:PAS domain S-box-containing protein
MGLLTFTGTHLSKGDVSSVEAFAAQVAVGLQNIRLMQDLQHELVERKRTEEELRLSEDKLNRAQAVAHIGSWNMDVIHNILTWSNETYRIFGVPPETPITYEGFLACVHPQDVDIVNQAWRAALQGSQYDIEHRIIAHGQVKWVRERAELEFGTDGAILCGIGTVQDITERKQAEELIHQYANELEQRVEERTAELVHASRAKDEFLANMSHELRTPLNGILGFSETLLEGIRGPLNEKQAQAIEIVQSSGQHLLGLINDILDVSKIESGKFELLPETLMVNDICRASLNFIKQMANKKAITVEYSSHPAASTLVADPKRLKQILVNLLNNAVKFTPEKGRIMLDVRADASAGVMRFSITDTGIGIAPENQQKLFKPFIQVDSSLSRQYEGGLGLSLVKKLVEMHGGSIELESEIGKGSCFAFTLPWQPSVDVAEEQYLLSPKDNSHPAPTDSSSIRQGKILIVDDNESNIIMVKDYLESRSYQTRIAFNGSEAIKQAMEFLPDLILMDVQMPHMNGFEATKRLRADPKFATVPIIALTAFAMSGDRERCIEAGMDQYLSKPVKLKELQQMIERFLDHPASE